MGYASVEAEQGGRKRYRVTAEGESFLAANKDGLAALLERVGQPGGGRFEGVPSPILRGMENLKLALRLRLRNGPLADPAIDAIADALDPPPPRPWSASQNDRNLSQSGSRFERRDNRNAERAEISGASASTFSTSFPPNFADSAGTIDFPIGRCGLRAKDGEIGRYSWLPRTQFDSTQLQDVVARHLVRFAFREELAIAWSGHEA